MSLNLTQAGRARRLVSIALEQLVEIEPHPTDEFFTHWRCSLCAHPGSAVDRQTALNEAADHLAQAHGARGGRHRHTRRRTR